MAEKIRILIKNPELRKKMAESGQKTIQESFTLKHSAEGFLEAVKYVMREA